MTDRQLPSPHSPDVGELHDPAIAPAHKEKSAMDSTSASRSPSATLRTSQKSIGLLSRFTRVRIGSGILHDIRSRAPYYISDWTDAWNYRVIPAVVLIFFAK